MKRIKLTFAGLTIEFTDRNRALERVEECVEGVVSQPIVVYGPEGCGKSAWVSPRQLFVLAPGFPGSARVFTASQPGLSGLHVTPKPLLRVESRSSSIKTHHQLGTHGKTNKFKPTTCNNPQLTTSNYRSVTGLDKSPSR